MIQVLFILLFVVPCFLAAYFLNKQRQENTAIGKFIEDAGVSKEISWETAKKLSQHIRKTFNSDQNTFVNLSMAKRSFLREDSRQLLQIQEGLCGEGARVLICALTQLGFDACRLTLFTRWLHPSHTIISIEVDNQEYFVDTLNSKEEFNQFLMNQRVSTSDFLIMGYEENVDRRRSIKQKLRSSEQDPIVKRLLTDKYYCYSYESIPISKITNLLKLDLRTLNLRRPGRCLACLAEKPNELKAMFWLIFELVALTIYGIYWVLA